MPSGAGDLTVNDVAVDPLDDNVWMLPGTYVVGDEDYQYAEVPGAVASDAFRKEVPRQIDAFPADLSYGESGRAAVTYEVDESYGYGPRDWQPQTEESDLYLSLVMATEEGGGLVVSISEWAWRRSGQFRGGGSAHRFRPQVPLPAPGA